MMQRATLIQALLIPAAASQSVPTRVVHAVPGAPAVDVYVSGVGLALSNLTYQQASIFVPVPTGIHDITVTLSSSNATVLSAPGLAFNPVKDTYGLEVYAAPNPNKTSAAGAIIPIIHPVKTTPSIPYPNPVGSYCNSRVTHQVAGVPTLDIWVVGSEGTNKRGQVSFGQAFPSPGPKGNGLYTVIPDTEDIPYAVVTVCLPGDQPPCKLPTKKGQKRAPELNAECGKAGKIIFESIAIVGSADSEAEIVQFYP